MWAPVVAGAGQVCEVLPEWEAAAAAVWDQPGVVVLLGGPDSGKTTLAACLAERWRRGGRVVGLVDADLGQSSIGPPATVGLALLGSDRRPSCPPAADALEFVGATSPPGCFLPHVLGTQAMAREALDRGADIVLVDTTGLVLGPAAVALKRYKLRALRPRHLLALERAGELEPLLRLVGGRDWLQVHRLPVSPRATRRSPAARRAYREARFRDYFHAAGRYRLARVGLRLAGLDAGEPPDAGRLTGVLLGLRDGAGRVQALGVLEEAARDQFTILAPLSDPAGIAEVEFGRTRIEPGGRELGDL
jgi:polynucleotide 5'-hydroxyl-kinase GRC3/NOL9